MFMKVQTQKNQLRQGIAIMEFAVVFPFLLLMLLGIWELGRIIQVQQVMMNAARNGARLAAQAFIVNTFGAYTQITTNSGYPNVYGTMSEFLIGNGITNLNNVKMNFTFLSGDTTRQPWQGNKNEPFQITLTIPYNNVRLTTLTLFAPTNLTVQVQWQMLVDAPFAVSTTLPGWSP